MSKAGTRNQSGACHCGSGKTLAQCCGAILSGITVAETAEALMRSRYTAYVTQDEGYLLATWHASTRPAELDVNQPDAPNWIGLKIVTVDGGGRDDESGIVEFIARYKINGKAHRMQEKSRFVKEQGKWFYVDGDVKES